MSWRTLTGCLIFAGLAAPAQAGNVDLSIDSSLADYVLEVSCSGEPVDEERLRASKVLRAQIKHHSGLREKYSMDAYIEGLKAASRCETLEEDIFRFRYAVNEKEELGRAIAFLKSHEDELVAFVIGKTAPYFPADKQFSGEIVLSAAGLSCGGFSMDGAFFIDVPCIAGDVEDEFSAIKILSAHETYHAMQYVFFAPFDEDMQVINTPAAAQDYLFMSLLTEGTAEYVADSREVTGEGPFAKLSADSAAKGHRKVNTNMRMVGYAAEVLGRPGNSKQRVGDMYRLGFSGETGQVFYYVGAAMAKTIEAAFGREALVCIIALTPEQFVLAYDAASAKAVTDATPIGAGAVRAAQKLGAGKVSYQECLQ
jgi:hypothetical protein